MTARLPSCHARDAERVLFRLGFSFVRQRGSHRSYFREADRRHVTIPWHSGDIKPGTLRSILKQADVTPEEFHALLRGKRAA